MSTPLLISYDNAPTDTTNLFRKTLDSNKWDYKILGEGEKWEGFMTKINAYNNFLKTIDDNRIVIISDARDVVCLRGPKAFTKGFESFNRDMVVSMEIFCGGYYDVPADFRCVQCKPLTEYWKYYSITSLPIRKYVNSGLMAGKASALKHCLSWIIDNKFTDDQLGLGNYMITFPERVAADIDASLLHTTTFGVNAGIQSIHVQKHDSPTFAEFFGRAAFFLHIPGMKGTGQCVIYNYVKTMVNTGASNDILCEPYKYKEPEWDEIF